MIDHGIAIVIVVTVGFSLLSIGMPIFVSLMCAGTLGVFLIEGTKALHFISLQLFQPLWYFGWVALPAYIWLGSIFNVTGLGEEVYSSVNKWVGWLPGGLGIATTGSDAIFGTISGSSMAACATIAPISYPAMRKAGYSETVAAGVNASAGGLASMIPPSINMIVYANIAGLSVGSLFFAGFGPGLLLSVLFSAYLFLRGLITPKAIPRGAGFSWAERFRGLKNILPVFAIFMAIFATLYTGVCTATEAGVLGCFATIIVTFGYRRLSLPRLLESLRHAVHTCCMVFLIVIGAYIINYFFFISGIQETIHTIILDFKASPFVAVSGMMFIMLLLGCVLETTAMYMLTIPFFVPTITELGIDPILFGIMMILSGEMAQITPPVGVNLFVLQGVTGVPLLRVARGAAPYVIILCLAFMVLYYCPQIALWLPNRMWTR